MINPLHIINAIRSPYLYLDVAEDIEVFANTINIGNRAVTARCRYRGSMGDALLKCYYRTIDYGAEIYGERFHPNALRIYTIGGRTEFADILLDSWIAGDPMDVCVDNPECDFGRLSRAFDRMALDLLSEEWAHGDIKPDNIICCPDGSMQLIDMDAMWREGLPLKRCHEYGTPEFNHPCRRKMTSGKHIDDFSIALISTILAAAAHRPAMFRAALDTRRKIFIPARIVEGCDKYFNYALTLLHASGDDAHYCLGTSLRTDDGIIPNLKELVERALNSRYEDYEPHAELSLAAEATATYTTK